MGPGWEVHLTGNISKPWKSYVLALPPFWTFFWCAVLTGAGSARCPAEAACPGAQLELKRTR